MVQDFPYMHVSTDGFEMRLKNGSIVIMKKSSTWSTENGKDWVHRDGLFSSEELCSVKALITDYYFQYPDDPVAKKSCKSPEQDVLHWTKHQDKASW